MTRGIITFAALLVCRTAFAQDDVVVTGARREVGQTTLAARDIREMPGAFGDAFRAVDALPGVTPMLSGLPYSFIRGAPPSNSGYFIDGIRVPLLFHLAYGPSVLPPALIDRVDFYPGAPPVSYGGYAGAIIAGQTREPSPELRGAVGIRLVDAGALVESPFADGRGDALAAARYGYPGPIVSLLSDTRLGYWDYQARAGWRIDDKSRISVFVFGSHDFLGHIDTSSHGEGPPSGDTIEDFVSDFHRVDLRLDRELTDGHLRIAGTFGYDSQGAAPSYLSNTSGALRIELEKRLAPSLRLRGGLEGRLDAYRYEQGAPPNANDPPVPSSVDPAPKNLTAIAHLDAVWRVTPRLEIVPGMRVTAFSSERAGTRTTVPALDPRLATRLALTRAAAIVSTVGITNQLPNLRVGSVPAAFLTGPGFATGASRLQTVGQASEGVEIALPEDVSLTVTGFLAGWSGLSDLTASCIQIAPAVDPRPLDARTPQPPVPYTCPSEKPVHGQSYGGELLLRRSLGKRVSGWLSYTLSRSTREQHFITPSGGDAVASVPSDFDRTHVLNAVLAYELPRRWRVGGRFVFYSGAPYSQLAGNVAVPPYNSVRDPPFFRVDVRIEKRWPLGERGFIAFVVEGQNITLSKEQSGLGTDCIGPLAGDDSAHCQRATIGPITLPSIGAEALF